MLVAAKVLIASYWKQEKVPTTTEWLNKCWFIMIIDKLTKTVQFKMGKLKILERFKQDWEPFTEYWNKKEMNKNRNAYKWVLERG